MEQADLEVLTVAADDRKRAYLAAKGVDFADVVEVFQHRPRFYRSTNERGERFAILGPNLAGRFLLTAVAETEIPGEWRVITAYWLAERRARRYYGAT